MGQIESCGTVRVYITDVKTNVNENIHTSKTFKMSISTILLMLNAQR